MIDAVNWYHFFVVSNKDVSIYLQLWLVIFIPLKVDYQSWEIVHFQAIFFALRIIFSYLCLPSLGSYVCLIVLYLWKTFTHGNLERKKADSCGEKFSLFPSNRACFLDLLSSMSLLSLKHFHGHCVSLWKNGRYYQFKYVCLRIDNSVNLSSYKSLC